MNLDIRNDLPPNTEDQAGIKLECSSVLLQRPTEQSPATVNAQASCCCENEMGQLDEQPSMQWKKILFFIKKPQNKTDVYLGSPGGHDILFKRWNFTTLSAISGCLQIQTDMGISGLATEPQLKMHQIFPVYKVHRSANRHLTDWEWPVRSLPPSDAALAGHACPQRPHQGESSALV